MNSRNDVGDDLIRQFGDLPPAAVIKSLYLEPDSIDEQEFNRAEWFWGRRPKVLLGSISFLVFYLAVLASLCYLVPDTFWLVVIWILAGAGCASIGGMRLDQWRIEYASSIKRVVTHLSGKQ
jgi:MFS family permease